MEKNLKMIAILSGISVFSGCMMSFAAMFEGSIAALTASAAFLILGFLGFRYVLQRTHPK